MDNGPRNLLGGVSRYTDRLPADRSRSRLSVWLRRLGRGAGAFYPLLVYYGLTHWPTRSVAMMSTAFFVALVALRGRGHRASYGALLAPVALAVLAGFAFILDAQRLMLVFPVIISLVLLAAFSDSLRWGVPMVERFARLQSGDLGEDEVRYCRRVTVMWCVFFAGNAVAAGVLALFAPLSWWALYTGILSYLLVAAVFAVEYTVRIFRFPKARPLRWQIPPNS